MVLLMGAAGLWLARRGIMDQAFRRGLSHLLMVLLLPCLLLSKLSASVDVAHLTQWAVVPLMALLYIAAGMLCGWLVVLVTRPPPELRRVVVAATAFGNSGYVPIPLVMALASTAPLFANDPGASGRGVAYVSLYLVCMSPCLWAIAYPYLSHQPVRSMRLTELISPPVIAGFAGILLGACPTLRHLVVDKGAPLRVFMDTADIIGQAAIPCALLVLGANLAEAPPADGAVNARTILSIGVARSVVLPLLGFAVVPALRAAGAIPADPMCSLVLMIEAGVPSATNLMIMCQVHKRGEVAMSRILVWQYVLAVPALTILVALFLWKVGNS